ncbi:polynucleotide kinase [Streptomyces phage Comrade]|uniref:Polynucleotide kinase n=2 Tax=Gilsonvirus comrade TaxID=2846395 RepID=A0A345ME56_9CAUD|nr:polynucleotide kinase [Streptomyces phage Comrade]AXH68837.1 polynucleotide kinase [Streptomyces phage SparkleGoddess]AXQ63393.1 polynucleotide kinase [Streptomyces phage Comrade]QZE11719.1 polynucleotide kinase [Streptomyces phage Karp]UTN92381.1 polynucleotide kinase [Streptomyces phage Stigma]
MLELVINRGIPGSGKSTYARKWVFDGTPLNRRARVNRDDIRKQLYGVDFGVPVEETAVTAVEYAMIRSLLERGVSVIVDDCNISQRYITAFTKIAKEFDAEVRVNLIDVELDVAIQRNQGRERFVPVHVIEDMYRRLQEQL